MNSSRRSFIQKASLLTAAAGFGFSCTGGKQAPVSEADSGSKKSEETK
jgi:hypothetical protein